MGIRKKCRHSCSSSGRMWIRGSRSTRRGKRRRTRTGKRGEGGGGGGSAATAAAAAEGCGLGAGTRGGREAEPAPPFAPPPPVPVFRFAPRPHVCVHSKPEPSQVSITLPLLELCLTQAGAEAFTKIQCIGYQQELAVQKDRYVTTIEVQSVELHLQNDPQSLYPCLISPTSASGNDRWLSFRLITQKQTQQKDLKLVVQPLQVCGLCARAAIPSVPHTPRDPLCLTFRLRKELLRKGGVSEWVPPRAAYSKLIFPQPNFASKFSLGGWVSEPKAPQAPLINKGCSHSHPSFRLPHFTPCRLITSYPLGQHSPLP